MEEMERFKILCLGNSHTGGYPHHHPKFGGDETNTYQYWLKKKWQELDSNLPELTLFNQGINGDTLFGMQKRLQDQISHFKSKFNAVLLMGGSNDLTGYYSSRSFDILIKQLEKMYNILKQENIIFIVSTIPPGGFNYDFPTDLPNVFQNFNTSLLNWAKERNLPHMNVSTVLADKKNDKEYLKEQYDLGDGLHLNKEGYRALGYFFAIKLQVIISRIE